VAVVVIMVTLIEVLLVVEVQEDIVHQVLGHPH
jgi:hypothetical protein